jgi:TolA-binding protein
MAATGTARPPASTSPAPPAGTGTAAASRPPAAPTPATPDAQFAAALALVRASDWPAAETAMAAFARTHPRHPQASLARYWAGRAQHNQGRFETAARTHFDNYQADQRGSHAQHSLYWVGQALVRLNRAPEACQVYTLAGRVYADEMLPELRPQFAQARRTAGCQG